MLSDPAALYNALISRDPRFDGVFYVGVTSTGIYCRPVCTARTPKAANCRFFNNAEAAEKANFRPCLRCRPELAPGNAPLDDAHRIASLVASRIDEGMLDDGAGLEQIAARFGWSSRQIRRIVHRELGVSPIELVLTRRLLLAKQLLTETTLPMSEVAFASGFSSLRRFNDAFSGRYGMPPTHLRKAASGTAAGDERRRAD
jgi:AraC family transcriptional regulator of adaptative response / DNA-3-methyladenine glycosylase II